MTLLCLAAATTARAEGEPAAKGFEIGVRIGYSLPMGSVTGAGTQTIGNTTAQTPGQDLSDDFNGRVPFMFDAGYRFGPHVYLGAFVVYAPVLINTDKQTLCVQNGTSCSGHSAEFGANIHYHIAPDSTFDPWLGLGFGYEWTTLSVTQGSQSGDATLSGFQFLDLQIGGDYKLAPNAGIGPFVMLALGQYQTLSASGTGTSVSNDVANQALHEWLTFGVRVVYDINP